MTLYKWSKTAANDATADSTINWAEGQAPSSVNDSARAMMAAIAKWRDDIGGTLQTAGTSTAYTVTTNQVFASTALMDTAQLNLLFHATNGASPTLNVDGLGAIPITLDGTNPPPAGTLIAGTPYQFVYYFSGSTWRLRGFFGNPYNIPIGGGMDYWGATVPNANFAFPIGQQISQTTYAALYAIFGSNRYGADGGGLFFLPDKTGRVSAMKEASATRLTTAGGGVDGATLGSGGGVQTQTLGLTQIPGLATSGSNAITVDVPGANNVPYANGPITQYPGPSTGTFVTPSTSGTIWAGTTSFTRTQTITGTVAGTGAAGNATGAAAAHSSVQPTIVCNYIIRII